MTAQSLTRNVVRIVPPETLRRVARWFMRGKIRHRIFSYVNSVVRGNGVVRIERGPLAGCLFAGGDTAGYVLGASEPAVQKQLLEHLRAGSVFFDVGANIGFMTLLGSRLVGDAGTVVAFEPLSENRELLERNLQANGRSNYLVVPLALSDECGTAEMVLDHGGGRAGFMGVEREGHKLLEVETATLDSLDLPAPDVVKIDVEGAEARVLGGMRRLLREHGPVLIVEIHGEQETPVREVLAEVGYQGGIIDAGNGMQHLLATRVGQESIASGT